MALRSRSVDRRVRAGSLVSGLGFVLLAIPAYDIWDDVVNLEWSIVATVAENALLVAGALFLVAGGIWITRRDWHGEHAAVVSRWTVLGAVAVGGFFAWITALQLWAMHDLKPEVIVLDGALVGALALFAVGVYDARSRVNKEELEIEHNQLTTLFDTTTDGIAVAEFARESRDILDTNDAFDDAFVRNAVDVLDDVVAELHSRDVDPVAFARGDDPIEFEMTAEALDGERAYLIRVVPFDSTPEARTRAYVVVTDVTEQKRVARERAARSRLEYLHRVATRMENAETPSVAYERTLDALEEAFDVSAAYVTFDGETVATRTVSEPLAPDAIDRVAERAVVNERDGGTATDITEADGRTILTVPIGNRGALQITVNGEFVAYEVDAVELVALNLRRTLERVEREQAIVEERERLEFVNRVLRHNLLNGLNVVDARVGLLQGRVEEGYEEHRAVVARRVEDMIGLVQTMRSFMGVVIEGADHELEPVSLPQTLADETRKVQAAHPEAEIEIEDVPAVDVLADELLTELVENLLENAITHNDKEHPEVWVRAETGSEDQVTFRVIDNGPGIPDDRKEAIFRKGEKAFASPGTGFGLYLVREIVDFYDGTIEVVDREPTGSEFRVTLQRA